MADIPFLVPGPDGPQVIVRRGLLGAEILRNGHPLDKKGRLNSTYLLPREDGSVSELQLRGFWTLALVVDGAHYPLERRLRAYEYLIAGLPLLLFIPGAASGALGAAIGAGLGVGGALANARIARSGLGAPVRATSMIVLSVALAVVYFALVLALANAIRPFSVDQGEIPAGTGQAMPSPVSSTTTGSSPTAGLPDGWITYSSKDGSFSVGLPGTPYEESSPVDQPGGASYTDHEVGWVSADHTTGYWVNIFEFPTGTMVGQDPTTFYDTAQADAIRAASAALVAERDLVLDGHPGREYVGLADGVTFSVRMYLVGDRLYKQDTNSAQPVADEVAAFFESFTFR